MIKASSGSRCQEHIIYTENVSDTKPATLLVTFVADTGADLKVDDRP